MSFSATTYETPQSKSRPDRRNWFRQTVSIDIIWPRPGSRSRYQRVTSRVCWLRKDQLSSPRTPTSHGRTDSRLMVLSRSVHSLCLIQFFCILNVFCSLLFVVVVVVAFIIVIITTYNCRQQTTLSIHNFSPRAVFLRFVVWVTWPLTIVSRFIEGSFREVVKFDCLSIDSLRSSTRLLACSLS